jgi:choline dehydrogenase-like flavoprotein
MILHDNGADPAGEAKVCIVGAGPVGLAVALQLAGEGFPVTVLEAGDENGAVDACLRAIDVAARHHASPELANAGGVGGTSRIWGGRCVRLDDIDFEPRSHVPYSGWPITHTELSPYYDLALAFLGCRADPPLQPIASQSTEISTTVVERWSGQPDLNGLHGRDLESSRNLFIHTACTVTGMRLGDNGKDVNALRVNRHGREFEIRAEIFVLAAGGLGNARLLLVAQREWPRKFGGIKGPLGRFYSGHLTGYLAKICFSQPRLADAFRFQSSGGGAFSRRRLSISGEAQLCMRS